MSENTPAFDYGWKLKEPVRESAKLHFERKPYEILGVSVEEYMEHIKKRGGAGGQEKAKTISSCFERDSQA